MGELLPALRGTEEYPSVLLDFSSEKCSELTILSHLREVVSETGEEHKKKCKHLEVIKQES